MVLKEIRNEEWIDKTDTKFVYHQIREVLLDDEDLLALVTREKAKLDELSNQISSAKSGIKKVNDFLSKNKKFVELAKKRDAERFCEKCGMDFTLKANKGLRSNKTREPYNTLCKNCATKEGL
jgi:RNase P subunit RPR2